MDSACTALLDSSVTSIKNFSISLTMSSFKELGYPKPGWLVIERDAARGRLQVSAVAVACTTVIPQRFRCFESGSHLCYCDCGWDRGEAPQADGLFCVQEIDPGLRKSSTYGQPLEHIQIGP